MALPRSQYVREGQEGVYHCFARSASAAPFSMDLTRLHDAT